MRGYANIYRIISMSSVVIGNIMDNRYGYGHIFLYINFFREKRVKKDLVQFFQAQLQNITCSTSTLRSNSFRWMARVQYTLNSCEITTLHINHMLLNGSSLISTFVTVCKTVSDLYIHEHFIILEMFGLPILLYSAHGH